MPPVHATPKGSPSSRWTEIGLGLLLFGVVLLVFLPGLLGGFIWDDDAHVTANACIVGPLGFRDIWTSAAAEYFPFVLSTFWVEHAVWGLSPFPYHVVTTLFHALAVIVLWRVLVRLEVPGAWLGALLWAIHPVQVESVAWISEMKNTESGIFYLLCVWSFVGWSRKDQGSGSASPTGGYFVAVGWALLAMLSKPSTVVLPAVLGLCWWWKQGRLGLRKILLLLPFALLSGIVSCWAIWEQTNHSWARGRVWEQTWPERFTIAGKDVWFYLEKLVWPHPLVFVYPRWETETTHLVNWLPLAVLIAVTVFLWMNRSNRVKPLFLACAYFAIAIFPVLGFFNVFFFRYSFVGDHFQYLASIGPLVLLGAALVWLSQRLFPGKVAAKTVLGAIVALVFGVQSWSECSVYRDNETLWQVTAHRDPGSGAAHNNLGVALASKGDRLAEATAEFETAVRVDPDFAEAHFNLGIARSQAGLQNEAINEFTTATRLNPAYPEAEFDLGYALLIARRRTDAIQHFQAAIRIWPDYRAAHEMLERLGAPSR